MKAHTELLDPSAVRGDRPSEPADGRPRRRRLGLLAVALVAVAVVVVLTVREDDAASGQTAEVGGQGGEGAVLADDGATLLRSADGLDAGVAVPTPEPGSYEYPTGDILPPWADPHPAVSAGASDAPEVFTLWMFVFNNPDLCTDSACDFDDVGADTAARGGGYQLDGRIADDDTLILSGRIRVGQPAVNGAPLQRPLEAEVHLGIAPHGKALSGEDLWRQLNGPLGDPTFWWAASFFPEAGVSGVIGEVG